MNSTGQYYYNARWYDPQIGRFTTEDPIRSGLNWYVYANNNPLKFVDPTGLEILSVLYDQKQNTGVNRNAFVGVTPTGRIWPNGKYEMNTIGREGCLFVAAMNIGNTIRKSELAKSGSSSWETDSGIFAASMSRNDKYFNIFGVNNDFVNGGLEKDFITGPDEMGALLSDLTGNDFNVERIGDSEDMQAAIIDFANDDEKAGYLIANVGGHFINITGATQNEEGDWQIDYIDPSNHEDPGYGFNDIVGGYVISEIEGDNE